MLEARRIDALDAHRTDLTAPHETQRDTGLRFRVAPAERGRRS